VSLGLSSVLDFYVRTLGALSIQISLMQCVLSSFLRTSPYLKLRLAPNLFSLSAVVGVSHALALPFYFSTLPDLVSFEPPLTVVYISLLFFFFVVVMLFFDGKFLRGIPAAHSIRFSKAPAIFCSCPNEKLSSFLCDNRRDPPPITQCFFLAAPRDGVPFGSLRNVLPPSAPILNAVSPPLARLNACSSFPLLTFLQAEWSAIFDPPPTPATFDSDQLPSLSVKLTPPPTFM